MVPIIRSIIYMRKKSHISLAGQIMDSMELDNVFDYRLPFYVEVSGQTADLICDDTS